MAFTPERRTANSDRNSTATNGARKRTAIRSRARRARTRSAPDIGAAAGGMAAGAAAGTVAGPVGTIAGAAIGAVVGGLAGKGVAEMIDPTAEEAYWAKNYERQPYYERGYTFADYHPGYRTGWEGRARYEGRTFDEVESELQADYTRNRGKSRLEWDKNRHAARAAWQRFDPDGKPLEGSH